MWLYNNKLVAENQTWVNSDGVRHPPNWSAVWSDEDKKAAGMIEVADPRKPSPTFYDSSRNEDGSYASTEHDLNLLKTKFINSTKRGANGFLADSDWQVIAKVERSRSMDKSIVTYRAAVLTACETIEAKITGTADMVAFKVLFDEPQDAEGNATGNAPIHDWPTLNVSVEGGAV